MHKQNIFDLIEGYYISHILICLSEKGFFCVKGKGGPVSLPRSDKLSAMDTCMLQILCNRTDIITPKGKGFALNPVYANYLGLPFHIDKFLKAYGRFNLDGDQPRIDIDELHFAKAFQRAQERHSWDTTLSILSVLQAKTILDLGSGPGRLAEQFCKKNRSNRALGIDLNKYLCADGNERLKWGGLGGRATLIHGNVKDFHKLLSATRIRSIDVVTGSNIFNEFFADAEVLVAFLKRLRKVFKGKYLVVMDYYGVLNTPRAGDQRFQHSYVHDMVQLFSGQGVPPADHKGWNKYYVQAGCSLLQVYEGVSNGIHWFVHIVKFE